MPQNPIPSRIVPKIANLLFKISPIAAIFFKLKFKRSNFGGIFGAKLLKKSKNCARCRVVSPKLQV